MIQRDRVKVLAKMTRLLVCVLLTASSFSVAADKPENLSIMQQPVDFNNNSPYFILGSNDQQPFAPTREFTFTLLQAGNLELVIYDVEGQQVRTLLTGYLESGDHVIVWDGNNNSGEPVSSGVYRYSLRVHELEESQFITFLR
ncbi:MAG TPA: FlgD immunoglobulin-like domain containing protein [bacterium]|nr:FlgD immunoglobulin-like domain containing protein [bacterium]HPN43045.1 FlgD immunoglobulin-like domain containing protein [bacterium]